MAEKIEVVVIRNYDIFHSPDKEVAVAKLSGLVEQPLYVVCAVLIEQSASHYDLLWGALSLGGRVCSRLQSGLRASKKLSLF